MYAILWRQDGSEGYAWYIRGIRGNGSFYGEVRYQSADESRCLAVGVAGGLTPRDRARLGELIEVIRRAPPRPSQRGHFALLLERLDPADFGKIGLQFTYRLGDEAESAPARAFLEVVGLVEPYLAPFYARLAEPGAAADPAS
jgi:hypothetical protein